MSFHQIPKELVHLNRIIVILGRKDRVQVERVRTRTQNMTAIRSIETPIVEKYLDFNYNELLQNDYKNKNVDKRNINTFVRRVT